MEITVNTDTELETPDVPDVMTNLNTPIKGMSIPEQRRQEFVKSLKPSPYVIRCSKMTDADFDKIYPPQVAEHKALKGTGTPFWRYEVNYCIDCHCTVDQCINNPYGFDGHIYKARQAAAAAHRLQLLEEVEKSKVVVATVVDKNTSEQKEVIIRTTPSGRAPKGTYKKVIPSDKKNAILADYDVPMDIHKLSLKYLIDQKVVRDFLAESGVLRKKGQSVIKQSEVSAPVKRVGFGRVRSTAMVTDELVAVAIQMLKNGVGGGLVKIAQEHNVNPNELSKAVKAVPGAEDLIKRGKKKAV